MKNDVKNFQIILNTADLRKMTKNQCIIYSLVFGFYSAGRSFYFTNETLCESLKICKKTLLNAIHQLEKKNLIQLKYIKNRRYIEIVPGNTLELFQKVMNNGK